MKDWLLKICSLIIRVNRLMKVIANLRYFPSSSGDMDIGYGLVIYMTSDKSVNTYRGSNR